MSDFVPLFTLFSCRSRLIGGKLISRIDNRYAVFLETDNRLTPLQQRVLIVQRHLADGILAGLGHVETNGR